MMVTDKQEVSAQKSWWLMLKAMRVHQWVKNSLLFVPMVLAGLLFDPSAIALGAMGFALFSLVCSGTYLINDIIDVESDRLHPRKRFRPIAAGLISIKLAKLVSAVLIVVPLFLAFVLEQGFGIAVVVYLVITLAYSLQFKRIAILDLIVLAALYTLRLFAGAVLVGVPLSSWLLVFSMMLFVALSSVKRSVELKRSSEEALAHRGYRPGDHTLVRQLGQAMSVAALVILVIFLESEAAVSGIYNHPQWLWIVPAVLFFWLGRVWLAVHRDRLDDDPVVFALKDPYSWLASGLVLVSVLLSHWG